MCACVGRVLVFWALLSCHVSPSCRWDGCSSSPRWPRLRSGWVCADARVSVAQAEAPDQSLVGAEPAGRGWYGHRHPPAAMGYGSGAAVCPPMPRPCGMGFKPLKAVSNAKCRRRWEKTTAGRPCSSRPASSALCISFSLRPRLWLV